MSPDFPVNPDLVWDYEIPPDEEPTESFRRWYVGRVLTRGRAEDIRKSVYRPSPPICPT